MQKLSRTAKTLDCVLRVLFWIMVICAAAAAVAALAPLVLRVPAPKGTAVSLDLDFIKIHLAKPAESAASAQQTASLIAMLMLIVGSGIGAYAIKLVRNILAPMRESMPFHDSVSTNFKKLGRVALISGVVMNGLELVMQHLIVYGFNLQELFLNENISGTSFNYSFDCTFLFIAAALFLLAHIFRYGTQLQQLSDETL